MNKDKLVDFQMRKVTKGYRDAYMKGYKNPYMPVDRDDKYSAAFDEGRYASRRDTCMEGTF